MILTEGFTGEKLGTEVTSEHGVTIARVLMNSDFMVTTELLGGESLITMLTRCRPVLVKLDQLGDSSHEILLDLVIFIISGHKFIVLGINILNVTVLMPLHVKIIFPSHHKMLLTLFTTKYLESEVRMESPLKVAALLHLMDDGSPH